MIKPTMLQLAAVFSLACASASGFAEEGSPNEGLLGDWGGLRTRLYQGGVDFQLGYTTELAYNPSGGNEHELRYADQASIGSTFDLDKLVGLRGGRVQVTITDRNGQDLGREAGLGTLMQVQEIYGRGNTFRWTQFWYDQMLLNDAVDVKLGRLTVGEDFMSFSCNFQNLSFCGSLPGNIVSTWYNWPVSQWAARLRVNPANEWYAQVGAYQINPSYIQTHDVFKLNNPAGTIGTLIPVEVGWDPKLLAAGLPGAYRIGAWYDSASQPNATSTVNASAAAVMESSESGWYLMAQQQLTVVGGDASRGLSVFANFVQADRDTAFIDQLITVGMFLVGPCAARPQDDIGFAVGRTHVNTRVADAERQQNAAGLGPVPVQKSEYPVELYYTVNATRWLMLRPNLQYIHHPGGTSENDDVVVVGLKASVKF